MKLRLALAGMSLVALAATGYGTRSYAAAEDQTLTGEFSDETCGRSHLRMSQGLFSAPECVLACTEKVKFVFVTTDKIYAIGNQDFAGLKEHPGEPVKVTGTIEKDTIVISKMEVTK